MSSATPARQAAPERGAARDRILDEALTLFQARGFADTAMQQIADAVGVTKAALYYHFASKEDLFAEVARRGVNALWQGVIARAEAGGSLRDTLLSIVLFIADITSETNVTSMLEDLRRHLPPETQTAIFTEHPAPDEALRGLFERAVAAGDMRPLPNLDLVAGMFGGMALGLAHRGHEHRRVQPTDIELLLDVFLHGVAGPAPTSSG